MAKIVLKDVRLAFTSVFTAAQFDATSDPAFETHIIIDPKSGTVKPLEETIRAVAKEKWEDRAPAILKDLAAKDRIAFRKSEKTSEAGESYSGFEGMYWLKAKSKKRPGVLNRDKTPLDEQDGVIYSGCYANVSLDVYAYDDKKFGKRIIAKLLAVQFSKDGDSFGGGARASDEDFEDISDTGEENGGPASEDDDDIPY